MNLLSKSRCAAMVGLLLAGADSLAQTAGSATLEVRLLDYTGTSGAAHWTVVWVTTASGTFIKTLRKQGPSSWTTTHWGSHCKVWNDARGGSAAGITALDGYTSATAPNYSGTNSPIILNWNCRDANNNLVADGTYKFWVQYAEDSGQGPYTTSGLLWTKGSTGATNTFANQGANFSGMRVAWTPSAPPAVAPTLTSAAPTSDGIVGVAYNFSCTASGTQPITFTAPGLPTGLTISPACVISGTPTIIGTFNGTITAANGTLPNATQPFSIVISAVPVSIAASRLNGNALVLSGSGPPNGTYSVLFSTDPTLTMGDWTPFATNSFDSSGHFSFTNAIELDSPQKFFLLTVP